MAEPTTNTDVVDELTTDHREATALLDELLETNDPQTRRDMADNVITELVRHSVAEEMYVYPVMREHVPDGEKAVEHDIEEHKELERTMKQLEGCDAGDHRFEELVRQLRGQLHHHATRRGERAVSAAAGPGAAREAGEDARASGDGQEVCP